MDNDIFSLRDLIYIISLVSICLGTIFFYKFKIAEIKTKLEMFALKVGENETTLTYVRTEIGTLLLKTEWEVEHRAIQERFEKHNEKFEKQNEKIANLEKDINEKLTEILVKIG